MADFYHICGEENEHEQAQTPLTAEDKFYDILCASDEDNPIDDKCKTFIDIATAAYKDDNIEGFPGNACNQAQKIKHKACLFEHASNLIQDPAIALDSEDHRSEYVFHLLGSALHDFDLAATYYHKCGSLAAADLMYNKAKHLAETDVKWIIRVENVILKRLMNGKAQ
eukprot:CAMPEP_0114668456 /NCGR_PEP_ID=MMETSP0191-20121206/36295_1 /TAXON_ID=126664 /ORGANISM="Sorites sp." /LENGTH=167 /DNA_ID=CAMNT_0001921555 /DNA_START=432 /DNA_END=936 /DNA_ORIENTATION=-